MLTSEKTGHSVLLHVTDFKHYLYVEAPSSFQRQDCEGFKIWLDSQMGGHQTSIHSVQMVLRENLYGFQGNQRSPYLKITVKEPRSISRLRSLIEDGGANYKGYWNGVDGGTFTYDSLQYVLRFMVDTKVSRSRLLPLSVADSPSSLEWLGSKSNRANIACSRLVNVNQIAKSKRR